MLVINTPTIKPSHLERILKHLPEPSEVVVRLGNFDYSSLNEQVAEVSEQGGERYEVKCHLKDLSNKKMLEIYRMTNSEDKDYLDTMGSLPSGEKFVQFERATWNFGKAGPSYEPGMQIYLTPHKLNISYSGKEPKIVTKIRQSAERLSINVNIEIKGVILE